MEEGGGKRREEFQLQLTDEYYWRANEREHNQKVNANRRTVRCSVITAKLRRSSLLCCQYVLLLEKSHREKKKA